MPPEISTPREFSLRRRRGPGFQCAPASVSIWPRSPSERPPQIPYGSWTCKACARQAAIAGHSKQTALAWASRRARAGPRSPSGWKKKELAIPRQAACNCQSHRSAFGPGRRLVSATSIPSMTSNAAKRGAAMNEAVVSEPATRQVGHAPFSMFSTMPGIAARSTTKHRPPGRSRFCTTGDGLEGVLRWGRIRADPGAVDLPTLDRFSSRDKSLIMFFVDLDDDDLGCVPTGRSHACADSPCVASVTGPVPPSDDPGMWRLVSDRLLSAVNSASNTGECPKHPLSGPYLRHADVARSDRPPGIAAQVPSEPSAGGVT